MPQKKPSLLRLKKDKLGEKGDTGMKSSSVFLGKADWRRDLTEQMSVNHSNKRNAGAQQVVL